MKIEAIERFMALLKRAAQANSRDVRIDIKDATILAAELAVVLARAASAVPPVNTVSHRLNADAGQF